jgi:5-methylthioribose kinase
LEKSRLAFIDSLFADMIGFAACKMIRRIFGFAHVADFDAIKDADMRAACETRALKLARLMLLEPHRFEKIEDITSAATRAA